MRLDINKKSSRNWVNEEFHPARSGLGDNRNKDIGGKQNNLCNYRLRNSV